MDVPGSVLLDGLLPAGIPFAPAEGDAGTGMTATNAVAPRTGNVSAGTSIFSMVVLEKPLEKVYEEIDLVTTPAGAPVAMVHCNNCTNDTNAWVNVLGGVNGHPLFRQNIHADLQGGHGGVELGLKEVRQGEICLRRPDGQGTAPAEGDAGTGMTATNAVAPRTGNVSAGTSIFSMVVAAAGPVMVFCQVRKGVRSFQSLSKAR